jgi:hypothetical protein
MKQTAVEFLYEILHKQNYIYEDMSEYLKQAKEMEEQNTIEILESYHNSLFNIPLKEGEAKRIVEHIKKEL